MGGSSIRNPVKRVLRWGQPGGRRSDRQVSSAHQPRSVAREDTERHVEHPGDIGVDDRHVGLGARAQAAEVVPDAYSDRRYRASVVKLYPQINRQKGTLKVEAKILEPDAKLRPDMSVRIHFLGDDASPLAGGPALVLAPRSALRSDASA